MTSSVENVMLHAITYQYHTQLECWTLLILVENVENLLMQLDSCFSLRNFVYFSHSTQRSITVFFFISQLLSPTILFFNRFFTVRKSKNSYQSIDVTRDGRRYGFCGVYLVFCSTLSENTKCENESVSA